MEACNELSTVNTSEMKTEVLSEEKDKINEPKTEEEDDEDNVPLKKSKIVKNQLPKKKELQCPLCRGTDGELYQFKSKNALSDHVIETHMNDVGKPSKQKTDPCQKPSYPCCLCAENGIKEVFDAKTRYQTHLVSEHHTYVFMCDICPSVFKLKANYKAHMLTHNVPVKKPFKCNVCNGMFVNRAGYEAHCRRFPGPHIKHTCAQCGFSFSKTSHIVNHRCKKVLLEQAKQRRKQIVNKEVVTPSPAQEQIIYRPVTVKVVEPLVLEKISSEGSRDMVIGEMDGSEDMTGQLVHVEVSEAPQQVYQVSVADWNVVAPFVIRNSNVTVQQNVNDYYQPS